jgi:diguanylate cyclase (GGDEF)-like protein
VQDRDLSRVRSWLADVFALPCVREVSLLRAQYRSLTRLVPVMYAAIIAVVAMLVMVFYAAVPAWLGIYAPAGMTIFVGFRAVQWLIARKHADTIAPDAMVRACRTVMTLGPALSFGFALIGLGLMNYGDPAHEALALTMIWVLAVISGFCLYSIPVAAVSVVCATTIPLLGAFGFSGHPIVSGIAPVFAIVTVLIIYMLIDVRENFARIVRANQELRAGEARIHHLAYHDTLTGLANRLRFADLLEQNLARRRRSGRSMAVYCIDLDRFKEVNDTFGHAAGDDLIRVASRLLQESCRPEDALARLGGDEFAIVRADVSQADANAFAAHLVEVFTNPIDLSVGRVFIGCSIGVCLVTEELDAQECLRRADLALYRAKEQGRGRHVLFERAMDATLRMRVQLRDELRAALVREELTVVYQPQVHNGDVCGVEALARWNHADRGEISPTVFVPIAEESGLIEILGAFVMRRAFLDSARMPNIRVAINVSAAQIRNRQFLVTLRELMADTAVKPSQIELEITEGLLLGDDPEIRNTLQQIRGLGFRIALDDFGTGYSSLSYLKRYPIDKIKIDRSFIANLGLEADADAVVGAIVRLARALNLDVIAEGVETEEQRIRLAALGCGDIQGYLFGKPMPLGHIVGALRAAGKRLLRAGSKSTRSPPRRSLGLSGA